MKQTNKNKTFRKIILSAFIAASTIFTGCYSVFSGGTGGSIVDAESTSSPKAGIANVEVYAYTTKAERDSDFTKWANGTQTEAFSPSAPYYGHTTSDASGNWTISKIVWKEGSFKSDFGKDADYTTIYLVFYHEDFGCTKDETIIMSDSSSDCTYTELTSIVKRTTVTLNFVDVATDNQTGKTVYYEVKVPQATDSNPNAAAKVYTGTATGNGTVTIRYPRYAKENGTATFTKTSMENHPAILVNYYQAVEASEVEWMGCKNDIVNGDYSFIKDAIGRGATGIEKTVLDSPYSLTFYGKSIKLSMPSISGTYGENNGIEITLKAVTANGEVDCGSATTAKHQISNDKTEDGYFSGLGSGAYWKDTEYTDRFTSVQVKFYKGDIELKSTITSVRSDGNSYTTTLSD